MHEKILDLFFRIIKLVFSKPKKHYFRNNKKQRLCTKYFLNILKYCTSAESKSKCANF